MDAVMRVIFFPLKMLGRLVNFLVRLTLALLIVTTLTLAGYVAVRSSQPMGLTLLARLPIAQ